MASRIIPNENTWIGWVEFADIPVDIESPTVAEVALAIDVTCYVMSLNASAQGNTVPTPALCSLFETSVAGTSQASFTGEFYRDAYQTTPSGPLYDDVAWKTFTRGTDGAFIISRFGGQGPNKEPIAAQECEVWPVEITSRAAGPLSSNTVQTFSVTAAVNTEPAETAVVVA